MAVNLSLSVQVWFVVGTSMVRCRYKCGSLSVRVWFVVGTSMVRCRYKYGSLSVRVWFVVGTSMVKGLKVKDVKSSLKSTRVRTRLFPGATSKQLHQYVIPILIDDTPDTIIFKVDVIIYLAKILPKLLEVYEIFDIFME